MTIISSNISKAVEILTNEDVVAIPTETVYGLAGNIFSEKAIKRIFEVKQRPLFNPLIVHLHSIDQVEKFASNFPPKAKLLASAFWPGSLTLVLPKNPLVPNLITANKNTVALRIPKHPVTLELLKNLSFPLAAPSANPFNRISPTKAIHVEDYFKDSIKMVLDGGDCSNGLESTIIGFEDDIPVLYRLGSISVEDIESVVGNIKVQNKKEKAPLAPGMLAKHYSPQTKTHLVKDVSSFLDLHLDKKVGVITFYEVFSNPNIAQLEVLSPDRDLREAAAKLYDTLHSLDKKRCDMIVAQIFPNEGLGKSINDRLERASN